MTALATTSTNLTLRFPVSTNDDILTAWLAGRKQTTLRTYRESLADFAQFLSVTSEAAAVETLVSCDHGTANRITLSYRANMTARALSSATIGLRLTALRSMVKVARQIGRIAWSLDVESPRVQPYRDVRGPGLDGWRSMLAEGKRRATTPEGKRDLALILLMHDRGLRRGECVALDLVDVDLEAGTVSVVGKGRTDAEYMTVSRQTVEALREWIAARGADPGPLFVRLDRAAGGSLDRLTGDSVCRMVRSLGRKTGLTREARPHGLRHQGITRALDLTGGDVRKVQRFSRHSKIETLMRYDDARRDDAGALSQLLGADA